jgi:hypothetical protein
VVDDDAGVIGEAEERHAALADRGGRLRVVEQVG